MSNGAIATTLFIATAAISAWLVIEVMRLCRRNSWYDYPGGRRTHTQPVPRLGGVAVYLAFLLGISMSFALPVTRFSIEVERTMLALAGASLLVIVMILDDLGGLSPMVKLAAQTAAAGIVVLPRLQGERHGIVIEQFNAPRAGVVTLPLAVAIGLTIVWIVGLTNTMNWIDGIDGLAASVTLVAATVLFLHTFFWPRGNPQFTISLLPLCLGAAAIGFLPFNWHPARIMLGDSGANFLGFMLAVTAIIGGAKIATTVLALGLPLLDVAWVVFYRLAHGKSPLEADRGHLHHRLLARGWSQQRITVFVAGVSALFGLMALALPSKESKLLAMAVVAALLLLTVGRFAVQEGANIESTSATASLDSAGELLQQ